MTLAATILLTYLNTLPGDFVFDDPHVVVNNPLVNGEETPWRAWSVPYGTNPEKSQGYRPLMTLSLALDHRLGGGSPLAFHLTNLLLHAAATLALYSVLLGLRATIPFAFLGAMIFGLHPIHVEAVANIVGRSELLVGCLGLGMMALHLHRADRIFGAIASSACFGLALLSKEHALLLPGILGLLDWSRGELRHRRRAQLFQVGTLAGYFLLRFSVLGSIQGAESSVIPFVDNPVASAPPLVRILTASQVLLRYLGLFLLPIELSADYSYGEIPPLDPGRIGSYFGLAGVIALVALALLFRRKAPWFFLTAGIFLIGFALTGNLLLPVGTIMAERLAYLPSLGLGLAGPALLIPRRPRLGPGPRSRSSSGPDLGFRLGPDLGFRLGPASRPVLFVSVGVLALLSFRTGMRNFDWWSEFELFRTAAASVPESFKAQYNLGLALADRKQNDAAFEAFSKAAAIYPDNGEVWLHRGNLHVIAKRFPEARDDFARSAAAGTGDRGYLAAAKVAMTLEQPDLATDWLESALKIKTTLDLGDVLERRAETHYVLGLARLRLGDRTKAREQLAILQRDYPQYRFAALLSNRLSSPNPPFEPRR